MRAEGLPDLRRFELLVVEPAEDAGHCSRHVFDEQQMQRTACNNAGRAIRFRFQQHCNGDGNKFRQHGV